MDRGFLDGFEHRVGRGRRQLLQIPGQEDVVGWHARAERHVDAGEDPGAGRHPAGRGHVELDDGAGAGAVVHVVVDQAGVAPDRDPLPGGLQVGLGGDRVLEVAELVADVGQQFDEGDAEVGLAPLDPAGHQRGDQVEQCLPEAGVVLGQVVNRRPVGQRGCRARPRLAVETGGAAGLEAEVHCGVGGVEPAAGDPQRVGGEIAGPVDLDDQVPVLGRDVEHPQPADAHAAVDGEKLGMASQPGRRRLLDEVDAHEPLRFQALGQHLDVVDPVEGRVGQEQGAAGRVVAGERRPVGDGGGHRRITRWTQAPAAGTVPAR